jgi:alcohol dehydrogenase (cytochrome c)
MTAGGAEGADRRFGVARPGSDPQRFAGVAKIDLATGDVLKIGEDPAPDNGAVLATDGGLIFHGDLNRRLRAFDAATGKRLWETILGGPISNSTITYAINGKQYVLVMTGDGMLNQGLAAQAGIKTVAGHNEIYAFALP